MESKNFNLKETDLFEEVLPKKAWLSLREACDAKGICYKTVCNRTSLQPNGGKSDGNIGGRTKKFRRDTVLNWLLLTDEDLLNGGSDES